MLKIIEEASCLQLSFFAYSCVWELFCVCLQLSFFPYNGKVCLRSTSTDSKQRSSTVSKKALTVSENTSPLFLSPSPFYSAVTLRVTWQEAIRYRRCSPFCPAVKSPSSVEQRDMPMSRESLSTSPRPCQASSAHGH